ncbi:nicotinamidase-related amidase [Melghiribacillus thermohalophilus]|uniref:Nicotinamidase-related amidase n=2 Tax=Melghiribacillus thermohalophilus TaxID=1324956 RepID=A0A4R3N172_9BACI|nr:hypothetical protein [Melghiribacillus thermohalophilus]TCT20369.1 nicotinamidase-related amidase [Melghiribacillus thermohalophilus]
MFNMPFEKWRNEHPAGEPRVHSFRELLEMVQNQSIRKATADKKKVLLLAIDMQNDFMDGGALGVPGARKDAERLNQFIYDHFEDITHIMVSIDTHKPRQIFHPCWWEDSRGNEPEPLTIIHDEDVEQGRWKPRYFAEESKRYVRKLEETSKKQLCIWPYHCLQGTYGHALESQFAAMAYLHSVLREYDLKTVVKGEDPLSEMYGIIEPEYSEKDLTRRDVINEVKQYDEIIIAGEAASHCVLESVNQLCSHLENKGDLLEHTYILTDCMSSIPGFEEDTEKAYRNLERTYGIKRITSAQWGK